MKKILFLSLIAAAACMAACSNSQKAASTEAEADSTAVEVEAVAAPTDMQKDAMLQTSRMIFSLVLPKCISADDFEEMVVAQCTPSFIEALKAQNDFEDGSIAWWALRTMEQEGDGETEVISIIPDGDTAVMVVYSDMGHKASTRIEFVPGENDLYLANAATVTYNDATRDINK